MGEPAQLFTPCSLLMASLFAYSASVQLNDPDWYFWFPLYTSASVVNLFNNTFISRRIRQVTRLAFWLGVFLFLKVVIEDYQHGLAGFWSLDLGKRFVREKIGSGFVVISMFMQLEASAVHNNSTKMKKVDISRALGYGMAVLVGVSYGLPIVFLVFLQGDAKR